MIYNYRQKTIKQKSEFVVFPDDSLEPLIITLWDELKNSNHGIGIAANQTGILKQVGVIKFDAHNEKTPSMIETSNSSPSTLKDVDNRKPSVSLDSLKKISAQEIVLINTTILNLENPYEVEEGCLSYPDIYAKIKRFRNITFRNMNRNGEYETLEAEGLLAQAIQHECDHFCGRCITDHFSAAQRIIYENRIKRIK